MPYALSIVFAAVARLLKVVPREPESAARTLRFAACALWKPRIIISCQNIYMGQYTKCRKVSRARVSSYKQYGSESRGITIE